jgi:protein O-mannosyl-transferase
MGIQRAARRRESKHAALPSPSRFSFLADPLPLALLVLSVVAIYANSLSVPFVYDDRYGIVANRDLHSLREIGTVLFSRIAGESRPVVNLSFALNYSWGGRGVLGYHVVNLALHALNGALVYSLVKRFLGFVPYATPTGFPPLAAVVALLFVCHPVQTEAVTYIWGRSDLLLTTFSLLAILFFLKAGVWAESFSAGARTGGGWEKIFRRDRCYLYGALGFFVLALGSKSVALSLPLLLLACDYYFLSGGDVKKLGKNLLRFHSAFFFIVGIRVWFYYFPPFVPEVIPLHESPTLTTFRAYTPWDERLDVFSNFFTQCRALSAYLQLLLFPVNLTLIHDFPVARSLFEPRVILSLGLLLALVGLVYFLYHRARIASFGMCWFLLSLSFFFLFSLPDFLVERRLYFPSIGFFLCLAVGLDALAKKLSVDQSRETSIRFAALLPLLLVAVYAIATVQRNVIWRDPYTLWRDAALKAPNQELPHTNLAIVGIQQGRFAEVIAVAQKALTLNPGSEKAHYSLLDAYVSLGEWTPAVAHFAKTLHSYPYYVVQWYIWRYKEIGRKQGLFLDALAAFEKELAATPDNADAHVALGFLYFEAMGDGQRALWHFEESLKSQLVRFRQEEIEYVVRDLRGRLAKQQRQQESPKP